MRIVRPTSNLRFVHIGPDGPRIEMLRLFYSEQRSEHLYPRTHEELSTIASEGAAFAVEHRDTIVAACYVKWQDTESLVREFGGVCVGAGYQGMKLASNLACVAIGQALVSAETASLKANVHIENEAPNTLLASLGFRLTQQIERLQSEFVRPPMKPSEEDGSVTGHVWDFDFKKCRVIAERLRSFPTKLNDYNVLMDFGVEISPWRLHLLDLATELDNIASDKEKEIA